MKYWAVMILAVKGNAENPDAISLHLTATGASSKPLAMKRVKESLQKNGLPGWSHGFEVKEVSAETYGFIVAANSNDNLNFEFEEDSSGHT